MVRNEASLLKYTHAQPSEIERLPYWQYELLVESLEELNEKEKEEQDKQNGKNDYRVPKSAREAQKMAGISVPKMPSVQMPKMPKL